MKWRWDLCHLLPSTTPPFSAQFRLLGYSWPSSSSYISLPVIPIHNISWLFLHQCLRERSMICLQFHDSIMSLFMRQLHILNMWTRVSRKSIKVWNSTNLKNDRKHQMFFLSICQQKEVHGPNNGDRFALNWNSFFLSCLINVMFFLFCGRFEEDYRAKAAPRQICSVIFFYSFIMILEFYCTSCCFTDHSGSLSCWWVVYPGADAKRPLLNTQDYQGMRAW